MDRRRLVLGLAWGCCLVGCSSESGDQGDFAAPPGFELVTEVELGLMPGAFVRGGAAIEARAGARGALRVVLPESAAQPVRYLNEASPRAYVEVITQGARPARARVRKDQAVVSYENVFEGVSAAYTVAEGRIEELLSVPSPEKLPELRYALRHGPGFGWWSPGDAGDGYYAFSSEGLPLFQLEPPVAVDAGGRRIAGRWDLELCEGGATIRASFEGLRSARYPLVIDPSFSTPSWVTDTVNQPPALGAMAATRLDLPADPGGPCAVLFGGAGAGYALSDATYLRCAGWQAGDITADSGRPPARAYASLQGASGGVAYLFGGHDELAARDDFWLLVVSASAPHQATWTQIPRQDLWPGARFMHGTALIRGEVYVIGGVDPEGKLLRDMWAWNGARWRRLCDGCFGGRYGASFAQLRGGEVYAFGGWDGSSFTRTMQRWDPADMTWVVEAIAPAQIPCDADGSLVREAAPGNIEPAGRYVAALAESSGASRLLVASGVVTGPGDQDAYLADAWSWERDGGGSRWARQGVDPAGFNLGLRESPMAVFDPRREVSIFFGGGNTSMAAGVMQRTRLRTAWRDHIDRLTVDRANEPGKTQLRAEVRWGRDAAWAEGYFVKRVGGLWSPLSGRCGSESQPLRGTPLRRASLLACTVDDALLGPEVERVGVRVREGGQLAWRDGGCTPSGDEATCHPPSAYFGSQVCNVPSPGRVRQCPP